MLTVVIMTLIHGTSVRAEGSAPDIRVDEYGREYEYVPFFEYSPGFESSDDSPSLFGNPINTSPTYKYFELKRWNINPFTVYETQIVPFDYAVGVTSGSNLVGSSSGADTLHCHFETPYYNLSAIDMPDLAYDSLSFATYSFNPTVTFAYRKYNSTTVYTISPSVKNVRTELHIVIGGRDYIVPPHPSWHFLESFYIFYNCNISYYFVLDFDLDYVVSTSSSTWTGGPAAFYADATMKINALEFRLFGVESVSTADNAIINSINNLNSSLSVLINKFNSDFNAFRQSWKSDMTTWMNRNHDDLVTLDANNTKWLSLLDSHVVQWAGTINTTLISWFTTTNNNINAFSNRNHTDLTNILHALQSADGMNGPLDGANDAFRNEMDEFDKVTDTSGQYDKIDPSIFEFDSTIFTSIAGTATFFGDMLTASFSAFGQFSIPLRLFLVCTLVSVVIGIVTNRSD